MRVPFIDLKKQYTLLKKELLQAQDAVFKKGIFILGENVRKFEEEFASYLGTSYCVGLDSGTMALILALNALGIGKNDEVIVAANSYIATVLAITENRAKPVFVECDDYYNLDVDKIEERITKKTRAILPVHLYGQPCRMDRIMRLARKYKLYVIEDCAQASGATFKGKKVGTFGDVGCFSFYPTKNLGCYGDGGLVATESYEIRDKIRYLRDYGQTKKYHHDYPGSNHRLDELQAAYLRVKLKYLDNWNKNRHKIGVLYNTKLQNIVEVPKEVPLAYHIYHLYVVRCKKRNRLQKFLQANGIVTLVHYPRPIYLQKVYRYLGLDRGSFPKTEKFTREILSLPIFPEIEKKEIKFLIEKIREFYKI